MLRLPALSRAFSQAPPRRAPAPQPGRQPPFHRCPASPPRASGGESPEALPETMSLSDAYTILGLSEGTGYEAVLSKKNALLAKYAGSMEQKMEVEAAYDVIFSQQLKARLSGALPVSAKVRFADVAPTRRSAPSKPSATSGGLSLPGGALAVRTLTSQTALTQSSAIFGVLVAWTLFQGLTEPSPAASSADVPGLQLALGTAASVYLLREHKRLGLGKAAGLAVAGLIVGTLLGSAVEGWLRVDLVPLGSLSSPGVVVGEFALAGLWAVAFFLA